MQMNELLLSQVHEQIPHPRREKHISVEKHDAR